MSGVLGSLGVPGAFGSSGGGVLRVPGGLWESWGFWRCWRGFGGSCVGFWGLPLTGVHAQVERLLLDDGSGSQVVRVADVVGVTVPRQRVGEVQEPILAHADPRVLRDVHDPLWGTHTGGSGGPQNPLAPSQPAGSTGRGERGGSVVGCGVQCGVGGEVRGIIGGRGVMGPQAGIRDPKRWRGTG